MSNKPFEKFAEQQRPTGFISELWQFVRYYRKWWLMPILVAFLLLGILAILSGAVEVETSDGQKRRLGPGEMFLADDCGSRGHKTRTIGGPATILFVHLPADLDLG